jgi:hypothetical protein
MKARIVVLLVLLTLFSATRADAWPVAGYQIEAGTIAGGAYRLTSAGTPANPVSAGGDYILLVPSAPEGQGSGCCCTYLPCALRSW